MSNNAIAIFVKTPGLSPVKTRLASKIGEGKAQQFYHLCLKSIKKTAHDSGAKIYWAVGEEEGLEDPLWQDFETIWTGDGDLGARQHQIYSSLGQKHDSIMLLGTDCPQLTPEIINEAFEKMQKNNYVLGPANDGGYYLLCGKVVISASTWKGVKYSTANTCDDLCSRLSQPFAMMKPLTDVDEVADLKAMLQEMPKSPTNFQGAISAWSKDLLKGIDGA